MERINPVKKLYNATRFSLMGLKAAFKHEWAFRFEILLSFFVIPAAIYLGQTGVQKAVLISSWILILLMELLNSAIEAVVDRVSNEKHELSGRAKDLGSAAVFLASVNFVIVCLLIYFTT